MTMPNVLACIDLSPAKDAVLREAAALARDTDGRLYLLHVASEEPIIAGYDRDPNGAFTRGARAQELRREHHDLRTIAAELEVDGLDVQSVLTMGDAVDKILEEAQRIQAGYIVIGSHGHGALHHLLMGSVAESVLRRSSVPVVFVPIRAVAGEAQADGRAGSVAAS